MVPIPDTGLGQLLEIEGRAAPTKRVAGHTIESRRDALQPPPVSVSGPWHRTLQPETSQSICRILASKLISIGRQPMLIAPVLLLDPDATMGNDLHKRLFLLVTGRGE
jgi:hypothetical protein